MSNFVFSCDPLGLILDFLPNIVEIREYLVLIVQKYAPFIGVFGNHFFAVHHITRVWYVLFARCVIELEYKRTSSDYSGSSWQEVFAD